MEFQNKEAVPVQIAPLWISQPRNQNQSIGVPSCVSVCQHVGICVCMGVYVYIRGYVYKDQGPNERSK